MNDLSGVVATFEALLRISEIEGGARKSRFMDIDMKLVMLNVLDALQAVAEDAGHRMQNNLSSARPTLVRGDRELLSQLFANLLENAICHCPRGSLIQVGLDETAGRSVATISDNGTGIPEAERVKVFQRLYRLEKSRSTPGSGLGLSLVAAIAELHGAEIAMADNDPGLRVTICFLPRSLEGV